MRLCGGGVYDRRAEPGARPIMRVARGFDIAIGHGGGLPLRFGAGEGCFGLAAAAPLFGAGRLAGARRIGRWRYWRRVLRRGYPRKKPWQQAE